MESQQTPLWSSPSNRRVLDLRTSEVKTRAFRPTTEPRISSMAIVVVCPTCHARFQVSEKFAGQKGPCPKCKNPINIPKLEDEVKIHAPEEFGAGGKDAKGRPVLKPIERVEAKVNPVVTVIVLA